MSIQEYSKVSSAIREAELIRLFLKKQKERDAMTLLIGLGQDKLQAIMEADREKRSQAQLRRYAKADIAAVSKAATQAKEAES